MSAASSSASEGADATRQRHDLVIVANRLPVQCVAGEWRTSPGGLVRAMLGVARGRHGAWVGWPGDTTVAPVEVVDEAIPHLPSDAGCSDLADPAVQPVDDVHLVPVPLSEEEFHHYYERVSNGALWPLYHDAIRPSIFDAASWAVYRDVNRRFSDAVADTVAEGGTVWVHDYHLHLVPEMVREMRPDVRIGFFLHIPFPPQELFMRLPWRDEIIRGLLGADVVGFQRRVAAENFVALAHRLVGAGIVESDEPDHATVGVQTDDGRVVRVGAFPISIDVDEIEEIATRPESVERARQLRECLGDPEAILLGVDRLDYTKGIDVRLSGFASLLESRRTSSERDGKPPIVLVQIAVPGREGLDDYVDERRKIEQLVGAVNGDHAALGFPAVHYLRTSLSLDELVPLYMAADVMLVTPLRDGMNLVAKEFVAARRDKRGVLVLSEFAGASDELSDAILVNPHDPDAVVDAMRLALDLPVAEVNERMTLLRKAVSGNDVDDWAEAFLRSLAGEPAQGSLGE